MNYAIHGRKYVVDGQPQYCWCKFGTFGLIVELLAGIDDACIEINCSVFTLMNHTLKGTNAAIAKCLWRMSRNGQGNKSNYRNRRYLWFFGEFQNSVGMWERRSFDIGTRNQTQCVYYKTKTHIKNTNGAHVTFDHIGCSCHPFDPFMALDNFDWVRLANSTTIASWINSKSFLYSEFGVVSIYSSATFQNTHKIRILGNVAHSSHIELRSAVKRIFNVDSRRRIARECIWWSAHEYAKPSHHPMAFPMRNSWKSIEWDKYSQIAVAREKKNTKYGRP